MARYSEEYWEANPAAPRKTDRKTGPYRAYVPTRLNDLPAIETKTAIRAARIERQIRALSTPANATGWEGLSRFFLRGEAIASSRIEGLEVSPRKLAIAELKNNGHDTASEIIRNITTLRSATAKLAEADEIARADLEKLQAELIENPQLQGIRIRQNWVGGSAYHPLDAEFVPPKPELLDEALTDLFEYLDGAAHGALIQAALVHAQFETLHPFADGNGRIGRALIHVVLQRRGLAAGAILPISLALQTRSETYVAGLTAYRRADKTGVDQWIHVFLDACEVALEISQALSEQVENLRSRWLEDYQEFYAAGHSRRARRDSLAIQILESLEATPVFTITTLMGTFGCGRTAATLAVADLEQCGIVTSLSIGRGQRGWIQPELLDLIVAGERRLASTLWDTKLSAPARAVPGRG